jgi:hypothetical protein
MRDHSDSPLLTACNDPAANRAIVIDAHRNLHGGDRRELERFVELPAVHVGDTDPANEAVVEERCQCADGRPPRRPRVRRVDEVEVDRKTVERFEARFAVLAQRFRAAVRHPPSLRPRHAALGDDANRPATQRSCEQPFAARVGARRVEDGGAGLGRGDDRRERLLLVGRKPHAPEPDPELGRIEPARHPNWMISAAATLPREPGA